MVSREGFEPPTCPLGGGCSIQLSYRDKTSTNSIAKCTRLRRQDINKVNGAQQVDRREYARVRDALGLHVQRLVERPAAGQPSTPVIPFSVRKLDKYSIEGYAEVRRNFPSVAQYIGDLEERIRELLLHADTVPAKPSHKVSLSAGGISFADRTLYTPGEMVSLKMTLFPTERLIGTDAVIVTVNDPDELLDQTNPTYHAQFMRISDTDRQVLQTHVERLMASSKRVDD